MPAFLQWGGGGCSTSFRRIGRSSSHTLAGVFFVSATVLHDVPGDAGGGCHVYSFSVVSTGSTVHSAHGSQFASMAAEVSE